MWEAIELIQKLFTGKDVKHAGEFFKMETSRLWTMPEAPPPIYIATAGPDHSQARRARPSTASSPPARTVEKVAGVLAKFDEGAADAGKDPVDMPKILQLHLSWAPTDEEALAQRDDRVAERRHEVPQAGHPLAASTSSRWRSWSAPRTSTAGCSSPVDPDEHRAEIQKFLDLGIDRSTSTTSAATRRSGSTSSAATCCRPWLPDERTSLCKPRRPLLQRGRAGLRPVADARRRRGSAARHHPGPGLARAQGRQALRPLPRGACRRPASASSSSTTAASATPRATAACSRFAGQLRDLVNAVTYLTTRDDVDPDAIGVFGTGGTGGGNAVLLAAVDPRVKAAISQVPVADGADWLHRMRPEHEWLSSSRASTRTGGSGC